MSKRPEFLYKKQDKRGNLFTLVLCVILAVVAIGGFWFRHTFIRLEVDGASMEQTLQDGDLLYLQRNRTVKRGDIIVIDVTDYAELFNEKEHKSPFYIVKRAIALEGDSVEYRNGHVWLKKAGETEYSLLEESYQYIDRAFERSYRTDVGEGEVFFLGDNRRISLDSSRVGCLPLKNIVGVVTEWSMPNHDKA